MNKRRREIISRLAGLSAQWDMLSGGRSGERSHAVGDVPGLAFRPRADTGAAEILIYGMIRSERSYWDENGIAAADVAELLRQAGPGPVNVRVNSPGGDVFGGIAIHTLLSRHPGKITAYVDGLAASAASFLILAADHIVAARNGFVMVHDAMTMTYGNPSTHRAAADLLDKVSVNMADMYAERAGEDVEHWREYMTVNGEDGTWWTGQEAMEIGLVDEVTEASEDDDPYVDNVRALLAGWESELPRSVMAKLPPLTVPKPPEPDPVSSDDRMPAVGLDDDFAHAMGMWALLNNDNGRTARKGKLL